MTDTQAEKDFKSFMAGVGIASLIWGAVCFFVGVTICSPRTPSSKNCATKPSSTVTPLTR